MMKLIFTFTLSVLFIYTVQAAKSLERCPENLTFEECGAYAAEKLQNLKRCMSFMTSRLTSEIIWIMCGKVSCRGPNLIKTAVDLNLPYPDCCSRCKHVKSNETLTSTTLITSDIV